MLSFVGFNQESDDTILFRLPRPSNPKRNMSITLMCTDTSSYLRDHQFFACTDDSDDSNISAILGEASDLGSKPIHEVIAWIAKKIWKNRSDDIDFQVGMAQSVLQSEGGSEKGKGASGSGRHTLMAQSSKGTVDDEEPEEDDEDDDEVVDYDDDYFNVKPVDSAAETAMKMALKK